MADHGQRAAEEAQAKVARRLKSIYGEAVKDIDKQLKAYTDKYAKADTKMRAKLAEGKITDAQYAAWKRGQVFTGDLWRKKRDMLAGTMYDADVLAQRIINGERLNVFAENMNSMAYDMEHGEGVDMGFGYYDSSTVARLLAEDPDMLPAPKVKKDKDTKWYRSKVNNVVTKGIIMGSSIPDMASEIARETGEMAYKAALRNARTAMTGAQNAGRIEAMEQAQSMGIKVQKRWMSTLDGRTRDAHRDLDGQVQDVDKPFESDLGDIMFPGDPHAHPGNVYNCRCTLTYVHPEYPSDLPRRDQITGEVIEDMSYREWENAKKSISKVISGGMATTPKKQTGLEALREIAQNTTDKYDFWTSLDEDQQAVFMASGVSLDDAFNMLHEGAQESEWKKANPGGPQSFAIYHDFTGANIEFNKVRAKSDGWMADANVAGIINVRADGLGDDWEFIISHEAGHQLADYSEEIQHMILYNPGDVLGRYNMRLMAFDGVYGEYNPEEAFATSVSNYVRHPKSMKEKYPETYDAIDSLFKASPSAIDFVKRTMEKYVREFR